MTRSEETRNGMPENMSMTAEMMKCLHEERKLDLVRNLVISAAKNSIVDSFIVFVHVLANFW